MQMEKQLRKLLCSSKNPVVCNSSEFDSYNFFHAWLYSYVENLENIYAQDAMHIQMRIVDSG